MSRISSETTYTLSGQRIRETAAAVLFKVIEIEGKAIEDVTDRDGPVAFWFPLSQIVSSITSPEGSSELDTIRCKEWILQQKELI